MTIERHFPSGDYIASDIIGDEYYQMRYNGYTKSQVKKLFRQYCTDQQDEIIKGEYHAI